MALNRIIGYVSISFGKKRNVNYTDIYTSAIFPAPRSVAMSEAKNICLFREDERVPQLEDRHKVRLERFGLNKIHAETRLRQEIQKHIVLSDFIIADISDLNPNVMLEVGFAQALEKRIIYITHAFKKIPSNLGDLKRLYVYSLDNLEDLKINLWLKIKEVISETETEDQIVKEHGGVIEYYPERQKMPLDEKLQNAKEVIQILTTNLTTVSSSYRNSILKALDSVQGKSRLEVTILTSDPSNPFIQPRADQLNEDFAGYQSELEGSLKSVAAKLLERKNCSIFTYKDFPVQLWHRIDKTIYIGSPSVLRRSRENCVFAVSIDVPGIKETFLDHFDELKKRATPYTL
jgi:hypothetical protein